MAVENKASKRIDEISALLVGEVIRYKDNRIKDIEALENAMLQSEKKEIKSHMDNDTQAMKARIEAFLSESESLVETYGMDDTFENQNEFQEKPEPERSDSNPRLIQSASQKERPYAITTNEMSIYSRLRREVDEVQEKTAFKDPKEPMRFEFVVMDTMANTDYLEKESDLRTLSMMNAPNTSISETIENEGWPAINAGMNLKAANYIPDKDKAALSLQWLKLEKMRLETRKAEVAKALTLNPAVTPERLYQSDAELKFLGENHDLWMDDAVNRKIQEIHERNVLILENKIYYGSREEESAYKQALREQIKERYHVGRDTNLTLMADRILSRDHHDYCALTREEAIHFQNEEQAIYDFNQNTKVWEQVNAVEKIAVALPNHDFYINRSDLSAFLQQQFEEVLYNNRQEEQSSYSEEITDYRTEIDPDVGTQESINGLRKKKQPTAASVQDELEEDVEYGIGEVGDSNQEAIEEYMVEEITIEEGFER
ncbi:hypothetical protein [Eubacterium sp. 1001713B170207_170306_E7]|uniref:hypothetical protein n=1 Tax=Eubacterium sp. 1001713B170207_170306_E7 TaxID=2787097 RepID=UPI001896CE88|nr:hypothetical protein [Eubacterium sp. 1001713B170207_170306_E7]